MRRMFSNSEVHDAKHKSRVILLICVSIKIF